MSGSLFPSSVDAVNSAVRAIFKAGFSDAQNTLPFKDLATDLGKSTHKTEEFDFFGHTPEMQDVTHDSLRISGLRRYNYRIQKRVYKAGLRISLVDLETDSLGQIPAVTQAFARKAAGHPARLGFAQLEANPLAYDGTALFADTRVFGSSANIDNLVGGTGVTAAAIEADLATVRSTMMNFQDDTAEPMELSPNTLIIPPGLAPVFRKVLVPLPVAASNSLQVGVIPPSLGNRWEGGGYTVYELARLTDTNNWYALHVGEELNPFVFTWTSMPQIMNTPSLNDKSAIEEDVLIYAIRGHYGVGTSLPQYFICVVNG